MNKNKKEEISAYSLAENVVSQIINSWSAKVTDRRSCEIYISEAILLFLKRNRANPTRTK